MEVNEITKKLLVLVTKDEVSEKLSHLMPEIRTKKGSVNWQLVSSQDIAFPIRELLKDFLDWKILSITNQITEDEIKEHIDEVSLKFISAEYNLSESFIDENKDLIDMEIVSSNRQVLENTDILTNNNLQSLLDKTEICKSGVVLGGSFIEDHIDEFEIPLLCRTQTISESFILSNYAQYFKDSVNDLLIGGNITQTIVELHRDDFPYIGKTLNYVQYSEEFIRNNLDVLNINLAVQTQDSLSEEFYREHIDEINMDILIGNNQVSETFILEYMHLINKEVLSSRQNLSESFILANRENLNLPVICRKRKDFSKEFILEIINDVPLKYLYTQDNFDLELMRAHSHSMNFERLFFERKFPISVISEFASGSSALCRVACITQVLNETFIEENFSIMDKYLLLKYQKDNMSESFINNHKDEFGIFL